MSHRPVFVQIVDPSYFLLLIYCAIGSVWSLVHHGFIMIRSKLPFSSFGRNFPCRSKLSLAPFGKISYIISKACIEQFVLPIWHCKICNLLKSEIFFIILTLSLENESAFITRLHYIKLENSFLKLEFLY